MVEDPKAGTLVEDPKAGLVLLGAAPKEGAPKVLPVEAKVAGVAPNEGADGTDANSKRVDAATGAGVCWAPKTGAREAVDDPKLGTVIFDGVAPNKGGAEDVGVPADKLEPNEGVLNIGVDREGADGTTAASDFTADKSRPEVAEEVLKDGTAVFPVDEGGAPNEKEGTAVFPVDEGGAPNEKEGTAVFPVDEGGAPNEKEGTAAVGKDSDLISAAEIGILAAGTPDRVFLTDGAAPKLNNGTALGTGSKEPSTGGTIEIEEDRSLSVGAG